MYILIVKFTITNSSNSHITLNNIAQCSFNKRSFAIDIKDKHENDNIL